MARVARVKAEPQPEPPKDIWHTAREVVAAIFAAGAAILLYGAWLAFYMHLSKSMPVELVLRFLGCAVLEAGLYVVCVRVEPLPLRRRKRKNVETPTTRQI